MFKIIRGGNLILETLDSRQTSFQYDQGGRGEGGGAGIGGINDLIHSSEGDHSMHFLPFMHDVKAASSIVATLTSLEQ